MIFASFLTRTVCPRIGIMFLSSTPPSLSADSPVQLTTTCASCPELWSCAASEICFKLARLKVTPFWRHWDTSQDRYMPVLIQTDVKAWPTSNPSPSDSLARSLNYMFIKHIAIFRIDLTIHWVLCPCTMVPLSTSRQGICLWLSRDLSCGCIY